MDQVLHGCATTTEAVRRAIQNSQASLRALARHYGFNLSNWYTVGGTLWTIIIVVVALLPWYQYGLGQVAVQAFFMHNAVGLWFTPLSLGIIYYALPKSLNKPIYSYSPGVFAFWTNLVFYPIIGAHHFEFSPLPWWLQTTSIVFSVAMIVPVACRQCELPPDLPRSSGLGVPLTSNFHSRRRRRLFSGIDARHRRGLPILAATLASHEFHCRPFASHDVWIRDIRNLGRDLRAPAKSDRQISL